MYIYLIILLITPIVSVVSSTWSIQQSACDTQKPLTSLAFNVCQNIARKTKLRFFYTIEINSDPPFTNFIHNLHENSIQTISITHVSKVTSSVATNHGKNIIFILDDIEQLFNLLFYTISEKPLGKDRETIVNLESNDRDIGYQSEISLPRYCIKIDGRYLWPENREACYKEVNMLSADLEHDSILSDSIFNATRALFSDRIWNFRNYLIFVLKNSSNVLVNSLRTLSNDSLNIETDGFKFCFKFFWRFFKGQRTVICHPGGCARYDPFAENLISYRGDSDDTFFDFSWKNMHKKAVKVFLDFFSDADFNTAPKSLDWNDQFYLFLTVLEDFKLSMNCTIIDEDPLTLLSDSQGTHFEPDHGMQFGIDLYAQCEFFDRLYTDSEIDYYRDTSSLLTVYAYFICGSPPSLHLGRLLTGKILFVLFSFSSIIITTIFLSSMTTLLSDRVLYPEIDSLRILEESDIFIQTLEHGKNEISSIFKQFNQSESLRAKIVDGLRFYSGLIFQEIYQIYFLSNHTEKIYEVKNTLMELKSRFGDEINEVEQNERTVAETDAFLVRPPFSSKLKRSIRIRHYLTSEWFEYHLMEECLLAYPLIFKFLSNSFYFEKLNQMVTQHFETGQTRRILEECPSNRLRLEEPQPKNSAEPRPFSLNDLQSAFIGLIVGLLISFLIFVAELLINYFQHLTILKFLKRFRNDFLRIIWYRVQAAVYFQN
ncbi:unnamed protein product [Bemisia tabaci]|uniref:Ionotropic receptor n=1 Tax=Bemisia tabaci TaxID=7038 RepID=A0A9P0A2G7_BEMTA|nr:unnamed protein product [Bemisia tabaci]